MEPIPIKGSKIKIDMTDGFNQIIIPHGNGGLLRYFMGAFISIWLLGWSAGLIAAISDIWRSGSIIENFGLFIWLIGWSLGGCFAIFMLLRIFRKSIPETFLLKDKSLSVDSGIPPFKAKFGYTNQKEMWNLLFFRRKSRLFDKSELKSLQLRETDSGNRLTIDQDTDRIDLASSATEIEREWLFNYLIEHYF